MNLAVLIAPHAPVNTMGSVKIPHTGRRMRDAIKKVEEEHRKNCKSEYEKNSAGFEIFSEGNVGRRNVGDHSKTPKDGVGFRPLGGSPVFLLPRGRTQIL